METVHIIAGFSDITSELVQRTAGHKEKSLIKLHFSFENGLLRAHDFSNHSRFIILAVYNDKAEKWWCCLRTDSNGARLISDVTGKSPPVQILLALENLYLANGSFPFRLT